MIAHIETLEGFIPTHVGNSRSQALRIRSRPVHPHARGEQAALCYRYKSARGSSPRTWGTVRTHSLRQQTSRFIPTHVGNSRVSQQHPPNPDGSSPRTWGTGGGLRAEVGSCRFIPTHVGNRTRVQRRVLHSTVHPHARGEQGTPHAPPIITAGSSPRTWGTVAPLSLYPCRGRFIPTHVGNRRRSSSGGRIVSVHPHARGEQACGKFVGANKHGSSPRTWGTARRRQHRRRGRRFIPTHVGNRLLWFQQREEPAVHPHARGEQNTPRRATTVPTGSSPRTWGTAMCNTLQKNATRFIPTHVGNRACGVNPNDCATVHPHARGEQSSRDAKGTRSTGSSPRTWGTD